MAAPAAPRAARVAHLVQRALGTPEPPRVRPIGEGGEHHSWWADDAYVVRLAPDRAATARLHREIALRDLVRARSAVPVPASAAVGEWAPGCGFTVDTRLDGVSAEVRRVSPAGEAQLASLLRALAAMPVTSAGIPEAPPIEWDALTRRADQARRRLPEAPVAPLPPPQSSASARAPVLAHADLKGEHLLVRPDGTLAGVLDWADAEAADPARDIAGVAISIGAAAARRVANAAGHGAATAARGLHLARCETVIRLDDRVHGTDDSPLPLLRAQLRRAWEPVAG
ncbi:phosphotransferase family protein [Actinomadura roseirufa]|uniref:phosphotransferase family protein n=1 Tax=Actinomadura roseirufa TaxID=2094049 RepID=UPI0010413D32|nr:aminoglycoside phosphotransferase family protein [Actinomadura roseirufa]